MPRNKPLPSKTDKAAAGLGLSKPPGSPAPVTTPVQKTIIAPPLKSASEVQWRRAGLPSLLSIKAVAAGFGFSEKTIRRWIDDGLLPHHRIGRQIRIAEYDLRALLEGGRHG